MKYINNKKINSVYGLGFNRCKCLFSDHIHPIEPFVGDIIKCGHECCNTLQAKAYELNSSGPRLCVLIQNSSPVVNPVVDPAPVVDPMIKLSNLLNLIKMNYK